MDTMERTRPATVPGSKTGVRRAVSSVRKGFAGLLVALAFIVAGATASSATPPTGESLITDGFADVTTLFTGTIGPAIFGLVVLTLAVVVGIKWLRRGAKQG